MSQLPSTGDRAARVALAVAMSWFVLSALAAGFQLGALWDLRSFHLDPWDSAWRLELAWMGSEGRWSGRDFDYPRGPLWQLVAAGASVVAGGSWGGTLGFLHAFFALGSVGIVTWLVLRHEASAWGRVFAFCALALLTNTAGVATFRAFLPVAAIVTYLPARPDSDTPWRSALTTAAITLAGLLISFDRFGTIGLAILAMALTDLAVRFWWRRAPQEALWRALRYGASLLALGGVTWLALLPLGFDLVDYVTGQRELMAAYAVNMAVGWEVAVPVANIRALFAACGLLLIVPVLRRREPEERRHVDLAWLAGALPAVSFASVRSDEGHMILAMTPALCVLVLIAMGAIEGLATSRRYVAGVVAAVAIIGWLGTYPHATAGHPDALLNSYAALSGDKRPDTAYRSDVGTVRAWLEARREALPCVALAADFTVLHAVTGIGGPTELGLRWSPELKRRLARKIREAACPYFIYSVRNFDAPGHSWSFGDDFLEVARAYEHEARLGGTAIAMRRREEPLTIPVSRLATEPVTVRLALPGRAEVPLGEPIEGTDLLRLRVRVEMSAWRAYLGGTPEIEWRFEQDGEATSPWRRLYHLSLGREHTVWVSPDPEGAEWRWITGRPPVRHRSADTLVFRASARGAFSPEALRLEVLALDRLTPPTPPRAPIAECTPQVDLLRDLHAGRAYSRWVAPNPSDLHFHLEPQPEDQPLAEILFPIVPCEDTCLRANVAVQASPERSDGVVFDVHVIDGEQRPRLHRAHVPAGGEELPVEVALGPWAGREVLLRLGTLYGEERAYDDAVVVEPQLTRCEARRDLASALRRSRATVERGAASAGEGGSGGADDVRVDAGGAEIRWRLTAVPDTCVSFDAIAPEEGTEGAMQVVWRVRDGDVEHVLWEGRVESGAGRLGVPERALFDWTGRRIDVVWDISPAEGREGAPVRLLSPRAYPCGRG